MTTRKPPDAAITSLLADTNPYLSCDECFHRLDEYVEKLVRVPGYQDAALRTHLLACAVCADEAAALLELVTTDGS